MVVRFVSVVRAPLCARVSRVCPVCVPAPPVSYCLFTGYHAKFPVPEIGYRLERSGTPFRTEPFRTVRNGQWKAVTVSRLHQRVGVRLWLAAACGWCVTYIMKGRERGENRALPLTVASQPHDNLLGWRGPPHHPNMLPFHS